MQPQSLPKPTRDLAQLKRDLREFGYCLVADALRRDQIARLLERLQAQAEFEARERGTVPDRVFTLIDNLLAKGAAYYELITQPLLSELLSHLLGPDYLLSLFEARAIGPGHGAQALHSDQNFVPGRTPVPFIANALWMLVDFTEENGATRVIPGSHLWGDDHPAIQRDNATWDVFSAMMDSLHDLDREQAQAQLERGARGMLEVNPAGSVAATGPAGTALVIDARIIHGAGCNQTADQLRWTILTYYCRPFLRQHTNLCLSLPDHVIRSLPAELRRRIGYRPWTLLGRYDGSLDWARRGVVPGAALRAVRS